MKLKGRIIRTEMITDKIFTVVYFMYITVQNNN